MSDSNILTPFYIVLAAALCVLVLGMFFSIYSPIVTEILPESWNSTYTQIESWSEYVASMLPILALFVIVGLIVSAFTRRRKVW